MMITQQARYLTRNRLFVRRDYGTRTDFGKALLKKFVFQIHPDYFENHKEMKRINATNLSILQNIMEGTSINDLGDGFRDTRSLVFYVKSVPEGMTPKRVKVSLNHLEKSVIEILETIGIDIPQMTEAVHHQTNKHYSGTVAATRKQTLDFLDSMNERKDLVTWREERTRTLRIKQEELLALTGARSIEYRHSWSSQNNSIMLSRLITLIEQHIGTIYTPWTNMNIVISKDASEFRLNYLDREIILDPTDVPDQWLVVLQSVNPGAIKEVEEQLPKFEVLQSKFESMAQNALLRGLCSTASAENSGSELLVPSAPAVHVTVKRGFTCSTTSYYYFLHQMNRKLDVTVEPGAMLGAENSAQRYTCSDAVNGEQRVQVRPMDVFVIIEDSHGTKLLPDGTFRIDVRADSDAVQALLVKGSSSLSELVKSHNSTQRAIEVLTESLASVIKWQSIRKGVGVDIGQFLVFLQRLDEYVRLPECKAALLQLEGLRVVVGHYLGMADDGACILPWEICLPTGGADENENEDDNSTAGDVL